VRDEIHPPQRLHAKPDGEDEAGVGEGLDDSGGVGDAGGRVASFALASHHSLAVLTLVLRGDRGAGGLPVALGVVFRMRDRALDDAVLRLALNDYGLPLGVGDDGLVHDLSSDHPRMYKTAKQSPKSKDANSQTNGQSNAARIRSQVRDSF